MSTIAPASAPPEAPFATIKQGEIIRLGDIKRLRISDQWEGVGQSDVGKEVYDNMDNEYARVYAPPGFAILARNDSTVHVGDICFRKDIGEWKEFGDVYGEDDVDKTVGELKREGGRARMVWFARLLTPEPVASSPNLDAMSNIPEGHRLMDDGELQKYGDIYKSGSMVDWAPVDEIARGRPVPASTPDNDSIIYCRPICPLHKFWYVDSLAGSDKDGRGTMAEPWKTLGHALNRIKKGMQQLEQQFYGSIITPGGEGLHHFDIDEAEAPTPPVGMVDVPYDVTQQKQPSTVASMLDGLTNSRSHSEPVTTKYPKHWRKQRVYRHRERLRESFPTFRIMYRGEKLQHGDLLCKLIDRKRVWVPCPKTLFGTVVDGMHDICARERVSLRSLDSFESKIDFAEQKLLEVLDIFTMIKADYVRSKIR